MVCSSQLLGGVLPACPGPALGAALAVFPALSPSKEGAAELGACIQEDQGSPDLGVPPSERLGGPRCFFNGRWFLVLVINSCKQTRESLALNKVICLCKLIYHILS